MDPFTLFALANGAVQAVKKGCQLYKDIKSAAGDVKGVLKDLDDQFHKLHPPDKPPTQAQIKQFNEKKAEVKELNKRSEDTTNIYSEIGEYLGNYYDNYFKCVAVLEEEEKRSKTEEYTGDASLAKRALKRVLMKKQLEQMGTELRELMIYQSPPELGALFTEVTEMTKVMGAQQKVLIISRMQKEAIAEKRRKARMKKIRDEAVFGAAIIFVCLAISGVLIWVIQDRITRYPELGDGMIPRMNQEYKDARDQRRREKLLELLERHKDEIKP